MSKIIAVDLDGTLLNSKVEIGQKNKQVLRQALALGHRLVIITGRDFYGSIHVARELFDGCDGGLLASSNGANVYDLGEDDSIINHYIKPSLLKEMIAYGKDLGFDYMIYYDGAILTDNPNAYAINLLSKKNKLAFKVVENLSDRIDFGLNKLLFSAPPRLIAKHMDDFYHKFGDFVNPINSMPMFLDCMPLGVDKGRALNEIANYYGIDMADTIAFGDEINDFYMIKAAGTGVAMANASEDIKNIADDIAPTNDEDGVGLYIERNLLG